MRLLSGRSLPLQTAALARTRKLFAPPPKSPIFALLLSIQASAVTRAMCCATTTSANAREQLRGHSRVHPARLHRALGFVIYVENGGSRHYRGSARVAASPRLPQRHRVCRCPLHGHVFTITLSHIFISWARPGCFRHLGCAVGARRVSERPGGLALAYHAELASCSLIRQGQGRPNSVLVVIDFRTRASACCSCTHRPQSLAVFTV